MHETLKRRQASCPRPEVWREIVAGLTDPDETLTCAEHASRCDVCGPLLRAVVEEVELNRELTDAERKQIASLASATPQWQRKLAERIAGNTYPDPLPSWWRRLLTVPALASAAGAVFVAVTIGWWVTVEHGDAASANRYLAQAYTAQRTLELRMPGADYAPLRVQKGPAASFIARPAALLKAEAVIADQLAKHPDEPVWLQSAARADVLEGKYDAAVESLRRALELKPHTPDLLLDLGTAYFQRAQSEDRQEDYGAAFEYLSQVLVQQPDNATALFNRAIVAEHQFLYRQSLEDWEHYLKLDSHSEWAEEARNRAEAIRSKLKQHEADGALLSPDQVASAPEGAANPELDRRVEEYLDAAVRLWLPQAHPEGGRPGDPHAQQALFFLADLTNQKHNDRWLSDLLKGASAPTFSRAVASLARASQSNNSGDYTTSATQAAQAAQLFRSSGNQAGALRAQFELAYSEQLTRHTAACRREATAGLAQSERLPYSWLQIQLGLEKGVCSFLGDDDWGGDERSSRRALERAQASRYDGLYVRAQFFVADDQIRAGDLPSGLKSASLALQRYWSSRMPVFLAFNLYDTLGSAPEFLETRPNLVAAIWGETKALLQSDEDPLDRAYAHESAARAEAAIGKIETAKRDYAHAAEFFALAPITEATHRYTLINEIQTAGLEARLGNFESGIARLTRIQRELRPSGDRYADEAFYATLGELELRSGHPVQAEQSFLAALESAEQRLRSLDSEEKRLSWSQEAAPVYLGMAESELVQGHAQESLEYFEWYLDAGTRVRNRSKDRSPATPDPAWLVSRLPNLSNRTVLAYGGLPDGIAIWVCDNRGIAGTWLPQSNRDLKELAARFGDLASDPKSSMTALRRDARSLYSKLIAPIESRLEPGRPLMIQADQWLAQVPFEALIDSTGHYLIERTAIVHSGSDAIALSREEVPIGPDMSALIVGSSASSQNMELPPLPDIAAEAATVARHFRAPTMLVGQDATIETVEADLPNSTVFHFTGHSLVRPNGAALLLRADSQKTAPALLGAESFRKLDLSKLQLAVLSACNTASGKSGSRGFNSIAETMLRAGVPHVVASRWAVDSVATKTFIEIFYSGALSGQPISQAIRRASQDMMANPRTAHPYYWAAFSAFGRP